MNTHDDFSSLKSLSIIDAHIHFRDTEQIDNVPILMEECGIDRWNTLCTLDGLLTTNPFGFYIKSVFSERSYLFTTFDLSVLASDAPASLVLSPEDQIDRHMRAGSHGVKLLQGKPTTYKKLGIPLTHEVYKGFYRYMETRGYPILWHVADPEEFWVESQVPVWAQRHGWAYTDGSFPEKEQLYREVDQILDSYPDLTIIFAHFYFLSADLERAAKFLDDHPRVTFDLTPGVEMYHNFSVAIDETRDFFIRYQDRILFGTDSMDNFFSDRKTGRGRIHMVRRWLETDGVFEVPSDPIMTPDERPALTGCALPDAILKKIYRDNFTGMVERIDKPIQIDEFLRECERTKDLASQLGEDSIERSTGEIIGMIDGNLA